MSNYTITNNFAIKDSLPSGDPAKVVKGSEYATEFNAIATAVNSKADIADPTFTGVITASAIDVTDNVTVAGTLEAGTIDGGTY